MKIRAVALGLSVLWGSMLLVGCGYVGIVPPTAPAPTRPADTPVVVPTATPDPCSPDNLPSQVASINRVMRQFDDAAAIARSSAQAQLDSDIANLQGVRRAAEDAQAPACLSALKDVQLVYMNTFIQTLLAFRNGADSAQVNQGISVAGQLHDQYMIEMARLLGQPAASLPRTMPNSDQVNSETPTPSVLVITNPGPDTVRVFIRPSQSSQSVGALSAGQVALALGQTNDGGWVMIEIPGWPGQTAWVDATRVQLGGAGAPPIITEP